MSEPSQLEKQFAFLWVRVIGGITLHCEHKFHPVRGWRFDFACPKRKIAIEIEGGFGKANRCKTCGRTPNRHSDKEGYSRDCEKYNTAALMGWRVIRLTAEMLTLSTLEPIAKEIEKQPEVKS